MELAHALLARQLFPDAPLKWMPPTKHMTGDIFRGYLLDGFFNLVGAMTGQGILLVGMMTEAVVTPFLSDRDLALQNVRYVMNAASGLTEDFHPPRDGYIQTRARQVLSEAVDLLDRIVSDTDAAGDAPLLAAIADGTFGLMKRPATGGKGLDGVCVRADDYDNPAITALDAWTPPADPMSARRAARDPGPAPEQGPIIRPYGDTTGDGMVQMSFTLPLPHDKKAEGAALQLARKMGLDPALLVHAKAMGPDFTFFVVYGSSTHLVNLDDVHVVEREYPLLSAKDANLTIKKQLRRKLVVVGACIGTDAHTVGIDAILNIKGFAGEKGLEYYREIRVVNLGAQVLVPELVARARAEKADAVLVSQVVTQKDAHIHNTTQMSAAFREAYPAGQVPILIAGGPRFEDGSESGARRRPDLRPRHDARRGRELPGPRDAPAEGDMTTADPTAHAGAAPRASVGQRITHRRYVPYGHAHYAGNLVDGAYSLAAFGDVATEMCIVTDGDEGLFASYSDVQFSARISAGDVIEISAEIIRVGTRSREMDFEVRVVGRGNQERGESAAEMLDPPVVATTARGVVVVP